MVTRFTYTTSAALALAGAATAVFGIVREESKPVGIGLVLILGAMVFARLYAGTRGNSRPPNIAGLTISK